MKEVFVNLQIDANYKNIPNNIYIKLMQIMFRSNHKIKHIDVYEFSRGLHGFGSLIILTARLFGDDGLEYNPVVVKCGPTIITNTEYKKYKYYVNQLINPLFVMNCMYSEFEHIGALGYELLHMPTGNNKPLLTLYDIVITTMTIMIDPNISQRINDAINILFTEVLTHRSKNGWYNDAYWYDHQRPLWFYNQILPPTLIIHDTRQSFSLEATTDEMNQVLYLADQKNSRQLDGKTIIIGSNEMFPYIEVVERSISINNPEFCTLYIHIFERQLKYSKPDKNYQSFLPIAARIKLNGKTSDLYHIPSKIDNIRLIGIITGTRFTYIKEKCDFLDGFIGKYNFHIDLNNVLDEYFNILSLPQILSTSIIHGDMNLRNILLQQFSFSKRNYLPLIIDFDKTQPGGHVVFDAVKLEVEYKVHILSKCLTSIDEFISLENALYKNTLTPESNINYFENNIILHTAYCFIMNIRMIALGYFKSSEAAKDNIRVQENISPLEYYIGLFAYSITTLKYTNIYNDEPGISEKSDSIINPPAILSYIGASFYARAINNIRNLKHPLK